MATRQGDSANAAAVAAPIAKQRCGDGPGGSASTAPVWSRCPKAPRLDSTEEP
jgi:hypothetical protein